MKGLIKTMLYRGSLIAVAILMTCTSSCSIGIDEIEEEQEVLITESVNGQKAPLTASDIDQTLNAYTRLKKVRSAKLDTYSDWFKDGDGIRRRYNFVHENNLVDLSIEMSEALEEYFKSIGAIYWTSDDKKQFWPDDIAYTVAAIAYRESTYRTDIVNSKGCQGITCIKEKALMDSLKGWLTEERWGEGVKYISFDEDKVDMLNPTTNIEYLYYEIGYYLVNWYKSFDKSRDKYSVWEKLNYSEDLQERLIIATHLFGIGNMEDSIYERPNNDGEIVPLKDYIYSDYVEDVLAKKQELINTYNNNLAY